MMRISGLSVQQETGRASGAVLSHREPQGLVAWFRDSKIVDEQGAPLVVHHGTNREFDTFENRGGKVQMLFSTFEVERQGFFFSKDREVAQSFGDLVKSVFLKIENPADLRYSHGAWKSGEYDRICNQLRDEGGFDVASAPGSHIWELFDDEHGKLFVDALKSLGYDGVIMDEPEVPGEREWSTTLVAFSPEQIRGTTARDAAEWEEAHPAARTVGLRRAHKADGAEGSVYGCLQARTHEFKAWFGTSQVVGDAGEPLVVHHGTRSNFSVFDLGASSVTEHPSSALGAFFAEHEGMQVETFLRVKTDMPFADMKTLPFAEGASVLPVWLKIENPKRMTYREFTDLFTNEDYRLRSAESFREIAEGFKADGHDGIIVDPVKCWYPGSNLDEYIGRNYIIFDPRQVKSAIGNCGSFDPLNPDLRA